MGVGDKRVLLVLQWLGSAYVFLVLCTVF